MITLVFYEKKPGNLYLTKCYANNNEDLVYLPTMISINGKARRYGIYRYAFWGQRSLKTIYIPKTIATISPYAFAGSYAESVYLLAPTPTFIPPAMPTLYSKSVPITFYYPQGAGDAYRKKGWISYQDTQTEQTIVEVTQSNEIIEDELIHIPSLYLAGSEADSIQLSTQINQIDNMAFLGVAPSEITSNNYFVFLNTTEENNGSYSIADSDLVEMENNKLIKGLRAFNITSGNNNELNYTILGPNSWYGHPQLSKAENNINIQFTGQVIDSLAFQNCLGLKKCSVTSTVSDIASDAFLGCDNLESVPVINKTRAITAYSTLSFGTYRDSCLYKHNAITSFYDIIWFSKNIPLDVTITDTGSEPEFYTKLLNHVETIPPNAFKNSIISGVLTIPANVKKIGKHAFENCQGLIRVECAPRPDGSPLIIEDYAFYNCNNVETYVLPNTSAQVGYRALAIGEEYEQL